MKKRGDDLADCCRRARDSLNHPVPWHKRNLGLIELENEPYDETGRNDTDYWHTQYSSQPRATFRQVRKLYSEAMDRWREFQDPTVLSEVNSATRWHELTQQAQYIFRRRQEEQVDLIQTGRFAEAVGGMTRRLRNVKNVWATDHDEEPRGTGFENSFKAAYTLLSDDELVKRLSAPLQWNRYFGDDGPMQEDEVQIIPIDAASLLCDIPVAIDLAGAIRLRGWHVQCWPVFGSTELLDPENTVLQATHDDLAQALSGLETFTFCPGDNDWPRPATYQPHNDIIIPADDAIMMKYLQLCISPPTLRSLTFHPRNLEMYRHGYNDFNDTTFIPYDLFLAVQSRQLRKFETSRLLLRSDVLRDLIRRFCTSECERFTAEYIELEDGSWYDIVEDLRTAFELFPKLAKASLDCPIGGEWEEADHGLTYEESPIYQKLRRSVELDEAIDLYITGEVDVNPFDSTCLRDSYGPLPRL